MWFGAGWTKALGYGWFRLCFWVVGFSEVRATEREWTFSAFSRGLVIEPPYMRKRGRNYCTVKCIGHSLREGVLHF